ncbi:MAG: riboflavin biosynthesis protein RibD [Ignavibacteria bacterium RBG_13_36_8]|nr:MAG: riboflavin biosynthesis protein RibD [Ignavibacteria bacterium RBG_13_36_8]
MKSDKHYIKRCFELAAKGKGKVEPNPLVGAVVVKGNKIIGEGWHEKFGGPHAEVITFSNTTEDVARSTLYCNLEPCCHTDKKTPPCVPLIISKKISRVVISNIDPNPEVSGKGIEILKNAGIEVITGILKNEGKRLNKEYFERIFPKLSESKIF